LKCGKNKNEEKWKNTLDEVKKFIDVHNRRPCASSKNQNEKRYGAWIGTQQGQYVKKMYIMNKLEICKLWEDFMNNSKYSKYFLSREDDWKYKLEKLKQFMDNAKRRPIQQNKNTDEKIMATWISNQLKNYPKKIQIMEKLEIQILWEDFTNNPKYSNYLLSREEHWKYKLEKIKQFIDVHNRRHTKESKNQDEKMLGEWISTQLKNYPKKIAIMKNQEIRQLWEKFVNEPKYFNYFISKEDDWKVKLEKIKQFIDVHNRRPAKESKDEKKQATWISVQIKSYPKKKYIMGKIEIRKLWENFVNEPKYSTYFSGFQENVWKYKLEKIKQFIDEHNKRPNRRSVNPDEDTQGTWIATQLRTYPKNTYIMNRQKIRQLWEEFVNNPKYSKYFKSKSKQKPTSKPIALPKPKPKPKLTNKDQEELKALKKRIAEISAKDPGYRGEDMLGCITKELINDKVAERTTPNSNVLILDTEQFRTAKVLEEAGVKPENIHIPQNDDETYREMQIKQKRNNIEHCTLNTYLDKDIEYDMVWMDYCCTFDGNKNISPKEDIKKCIELNRMKEAGYLCLTFSLRNGDKNMKTKTMILLFSCNLIIVSMLHQINTCRAQIQQEVLRWYFMCFNAPSFHSIIKIDSATTRTYIINPEKANKEKKYKLKWILNGANNLKCWRNICNDMNRNWNKKNNIKTQLTLKGGLKQNNKNLNLSNETNNLKC
jgi:hypothetical protein